MWEDFKQFVMKGPVLALAIGIIIGAAFTTVVNSLVDDIIMPPISMLLGGVDFTNKFIVLKGDTYATLADAKAAGAITLNYGQFINTVITFLVIAIVVFLLVRWFTRLTEKPAPAAAPTTKDCPYCFESIPIKATRCPECTSQLPADAG
jgi:large conductance mechanosensitive channel